LLEQIAAEISNDVWVIAPEADCSDAFGAPTVGKPLTLNQIGSQHYSLAGTPADCVLVGVKHLLRDKRPDLLLAGVNAGENLADDIFYSGTIGAAFQAALLDVPSISLSLVTGGHKAEARWDTPKSHSPELLRLLLKRGWPHDVLLNVNFPDCEPGEVKGTAFTEQGRRPPKVWSVRHSSSNRELCIERHKSLPRRNTDLWAVQMGRISVTPIMVDLTAHSLDSPNAVAVEAQRRGTNPGEHNNAPAPHRADAKTN
jgi:5'-nucleotidase